MPISSAARIAPSGLHVMSITVVVPDFNASAKATRLPARESSTVISRQRPSG
jgi:hypothetical protein